MSVDWSNITTVGKFLGIKDGQEQTRVSDASPKQIEKLSNQCNVLNREITQELVDFQTYEIQIEDFNEEIAKIQEENRLDVEEKLARIEELKKKKEDGTITKSEELELEIDLDELEACQTKSQETVGYYENQISNRNNKLSASILNTRLNISADYAVSTFESAENLEKATKGIPFVYFQNITKPAKENAQKLSNTIDKGIDIINQKQ